MAQVRGDDGAAIDHRVAERLRVLARGRLDPHRFHAERRILGVDALERPEHAARIDGHLALRIDLTFAHRHAAEVDAIAIRAEIQVVADVHGRHEEAEILRKLAAHAADAREQVAVLVLVHQRHEAIADFEAEQVDRLHVVPRQLALLGRTDGRVVGGRLRIGDRLGFRRVRSVLLLLDQPRAVTGGRAHREERDVRHARDQAHYDRAVQRPRPALSERGTAGA